MLEVQGITKVFGGLRAVDDASLVVPQGKIVALIGPNGAGKTTLFATIAGFLKPDAGRVKLQGTDITGWKPHRICAAGMVRTFQITQPFAKLSVRENIMVGGYLRLPDRAECADRAEAVAKQVGMREMIDQAASSLTVAGRKRLELARALGTQPKLLLLDEVLAGLNPTEISELLPVIRSIRDSGITILLIEHVMQAVMNLAEDIYVLANGKMIAHDSPTGIASNERVIEAYLGRGAAERLRGGGRA